MFKNINVFADRKVRRFFPETSLGRQVFFLSQPGPATVGMNWCTWRIIPRLGYVVNNHG